MEDSANPNPILWSPSPELRSSCALQQFASALPEIFASYEDLHEWSVQHPQQFWSAAANFLSLVGEGELKPAFEEMSAPPTPLVRSWFPKFALNFAENLLQGDDAALAIVSRSEGVLFRRYSRGELKQRVAAVAHYLRSRGVVAGDRVFAYLPNIRLVYLNTAEINPWISPFAMSCLHLVPICDY